MKPTLLTVLAILSCAGFAHAAPAPSCTVSVNHDPLVMRMGKNEFRIAFGVGSGHCQSQDCRGVIRYTAQWTTGDGRTNSDSHLLSYTVPSGASGSVAVDRHYFDTAEAANTTDVVAVSVDSVSCEQALVMR